MKESILLIGHGSPKQNANNLDRIGAILHTMIHPGCAHDCVDVAYMGHAQPGIEEAVDERVERGAKKIVIHPFFLNSGVHVTEDIPETIRGISSRYPDVEFVYTEPLGIHEKLAQIAMERISAADRLRPEEIENRSFAMLTAEAKFDSMPEDRLPIIKRVIHATADFDFADTMRFHRSAIVRGLEAIRAGKDIVTDVEMVRTGINKKALAKWGGKVFCGLKMQSGNDDPLVDHDDSRTRTEMGVEKALQENANVGIIAIGNAPTALYKVIEILNSRWNLAKPYPLVVGVPVGFVKAVESKALLSEQGFPFITALGRKGGTPVAVSIVNALLKMTEHS